MRLASEDVTHPLSSGFDLSGDMGSIPAQSFSTLVQVNLACEPSGKITFASKRKFGRAFAFWVVFVVSAIMISILSAANDDPVTSNINALNANFLTISPIPTHNLYNT